MAERRKVAGEKGVNPSVALLSGAGVNLNEFELSAEIDLRPDSVLRARFAHESPGQWQTPYPVMSETEAREVARRWRTAKPATFGASERFEAEVVRLVPRRWWAEGELVEQWTVRVRYPQAERAFQHLEAVGP